LTVTEVPAAPDVGDRLVICGRTVNKTPLLAPAPVVTTTLPVFAVVGTMATIDVEVQLVVEPVTPLNVTVPLDPKVKPLMVTEVPVIPDVTDKLVMLGRTVKVWVPVLDEPLTVTTTFPVVAVFGTVALI